MSTRVMRFRSTVIPDKLSEQFNTNFRRYNNSSPSAAKKIRRRRTGSSDHIVAARHSNELVTCRRYCPQSSHVLHERKHWIWRRVLPKKPLPEVTSGDVLVKSDSLLSPIDLHPFSMLFRGTDESKFHVSLTIRETRWHCGMGLQSYLVQPRSIRKSSFS